MKKLKRWGTRLALTVVLLNVLEYKVAGAMYLFTGNGFEWTMLNQ